MDLQAYLDSMTWRGIQLSAIDGMIRFRAPRATLTPLDREFLAANKKAILDALDLGEAHAPESSPARSTSTGSAKVVEPSGHPAPRPLGRLTRPPRKSSRATTPTGNRDRPAGSDSRYSGNPRNPSPPGHISNFPNIATAPDPADLEVFAPPALEYGVADQMIVRIGDQRYPYSVWDGETLPGDHLALDTETDIARNHTIPTLALATASDGKVHRLIHPDRLGEFLILHCLKHIVCHNVAFDHWVIVRHLEAGGEAEALVAWWGVVNDDRVHDTMHLDGLIRLGRTDADPKFRDLAAVAGEYAGLPLDKQDPYRSRYAEIIGSDWATVERGFFEYAIKDPIATLAAHEVMVVEADGIMAAHGLDPVAVVREHGPLGEKYLVKGAIALAEVTRPGFALDRVQVNRAEREHRDRVRGLVDALIDMPGCKALFARDRQGCLKLSPSTGAPSIVQEQLRTLLAERAGIVAATTGLRRLSP